MIEGIVTIVMGAALFGLVYVHKTRERNGKFFEAGKILGADVHGGGLFSSVVVEGCLGKFHFAADWVSRNKVPHLRVTIAMDFPDGIDFTIGRETAVSALKETVGFHDILTGDGEFDSEMRVESADRDAVMAILDVGARVSILELNREMDDIEISEKSIGAVKDMLSIAGGDDIIRVIEEVRRTAVALDRHGAVWELLVQNIRSEKLEAVLLNNIRILGGRFPLNDDIADALRPHLWGTLPVQYEASMYLGNEGMDHLAAMLKPGYVNDAAFQVRIIDTIMEKGYAPAGPALRRLFRQSSVATVRAKIVECMGCIGDTTFADLLVRALEDPNADVRAATVKALGKCGTVEAVEPLVKFASSTINPFLKGEIRKAIDAIQAGIGTGDRGMLSIHCGDDMEGALSRDDAPGAGALSGDDSERRQPKARGKG